MKRHARRLITFSLIFAFIVNASAIFVYRYEQEKDHWCWAAAAQMVGKTLGRTVSQRDIVVSVKGTDADVGADDLNELASAVTYATLRNATYRSSAWPFASATNELSSGEPFVIRIQWNSGGGHAVVASGYSIANATLTVVDPWYGCGTKAFSYDSMVTACSFQSGTGKWSDTVYV